MLLCYINRTHTQKSVRKKLYDKFPSFLYIFLTVCRPLLGNNNEGKVRALSLSLFFAHPLKNNIWHILIHSTLLYVYNNNNITTNREKTHTKKTFSFHSYMDINFHLFFTQHYLSHYCLFTLGSSSTNHHPPTYHYPLQLSLTRERRCCLICLLKKKKVLRIYMRNVYRRNNNASVRRCLGVVRIQAFSDFSFSFSLVQSFCIA